MNKFMRQAQELQAKLLKAQQELATATVEGSAGGGVVKVVATGHQKVQSITISPEVVDAKDMDMLQDLVLAAVNDALEKSQEMAQKRLGALTGGMNIPGLT